MYSKDISKWGRGIISIVDDFGVPTYIGSDIAQGLDGSHVGHEIAVLVTEEIVVPCSIDEGKATYSALRQQVIEDPRFSLIEIVVDYANGDVLEISGTEEFPETHIDTGRDGIGSIGASLPPIAAHEAERQDDDASPDHRTHEAPHAHSLHLHSSDCDVGINESLALSI